jgi:hypothetical protein
MSAVSDRWIGEPFAAEPAGVELEVADAAPAELVELGDAPELEELPLEPPHPLAMSAVDTSVSDSPFSLMKTSPRLPVTRNGADSIRKPDAVKSGSLMLC